MPKPRIAPFVLVAAAGAAGLVFRHDGDAAVTPTPAGADSRHDRADGQCHRVARRRMIHTAQRS